MAIRVDFLAPTFYRRDSLARLSGVYRNLSGRDLSTGRLPTGRNASSVAVWPRKRCERRREVRQYEAASGARHGSGIEYHQAGVPVLAAVSNALSAAQGVRSQCKVHLWHTRDDHAED